MESTLKDMTVGGGVEDVYVEDRATEDQLVTPCTTSVDVPNVEVPLQKYMAMMDLQGMGIPIGKLALYTALGGVRPSVFLPITIDVGINNEQLLKDEFYIGLRQRRVTGQEYADLLHEFMIAVKQNYGDEVLVQGTASVVLAGLVAALKFLGGILAEHTFLFFVIGEAIKPTVLIGSAGVGRAFTKEKPIIMARSTQPPNLSAQLKKLTTGVRVVQFLPEEIHLVLWNTMAKSTYLASDQLRQTTRTFSLDSGLDWSCLVQFVYMMKCFW
ncbi:NADP-dependent malic enzyme-like [Actinidia eriantha]|uniref:NADP-dependent malic enzyme-like n=1 Tax=Actinidia eriantha TaxID=165200 RepID=UPI00258326DF|nr:NADP-dependent malic enzyme-like [Actinidia eriantha]XP_057467437.1 NADP-dependent malic enzyme-like [Actinidia eriantha]XP_057467438.1 NADP-dependent malic enzyme-like [Actinidia eriantha]